MPRASEKHRFEHVVVLFADKFLRRTRSQTQSVMLAAQEPKTRKDDAPEKESEGML